MPIEEILRRQSPLLCFNMTRYIFFRYSYAAVIRNECIFRSCGTFIPANSSSAEELASALELTKLIKPNLIRYFPCTPLRYTDCTLPRRRLWKCSGSRAALPIRSIHWYRVFPPEPPSHRPQPATQQYPRC